MEKLEITLSVIATISTLLITFITMIFKLSKNIKERKVLEGLQELNKDIISLIEQAESFTNYTGEEKKEYVLTRVERLINNNKFKVNEEKVSEKIEELIELSNNVNVNKKRLNKELGVLHHE